MKEFERSVLCVMSYDLRRLLVRKVDSACG